jgi:hypothetical protein
MESGKVIDMTEEQIKHMANRFLGWELPDDFNPDHGIRYSSKSHYPDFPPTGTNLFSATQAEAMVRYMLEGLPTPPRVADGQGVLMAGPAWAEARAAEIDAKT